MHILLTRPLEDCSEMIIKFKSLGNQVSHLPLLRIDKVNYEHTNSSDFKGIIFTSANAIKILDTREIEKQIKCFYVGISTEKKAKSKDKNSYTKFLLKSGNKKIAQKVGEESSELIIDYLKGTKKRTIEEASDLIFHLLVMLYSKKISINDIKKELKKRENVRQK